MLRGLPIKLVTHNVGNVDSIGNAIFLAGEERYSCPQATFMFHGVGFQTGGGENFDIRSTTERLESLKADEERLVQVVIERTTMEEGEVRGLYQQARTMTADQALAHGIIHEVRPFNIPPGTPGVTFVFPT